jgi:hypothetical protein
MLSWLTLWSSITYRIQLSCKTVDNVVYMAYDATETEKLQDNLSTQNLICIAQYKSCQPYAWDDLFGFLPGNLSTLMHMEAQCLRTLQSTRYENESFEICARFNQDLDLALNTKMFVFPPHLLTSSDFYMQLSHHFGDQCAHLLVPMNNPELTKFAMNLCYEQVIPQIEVDYDYHMDAPNRQATWISPPATLYTYYLARSNVSTCYALSAAVSSGATMISLLLLFATSLFQI